MRKKGKSENVQDLHVACPRRAANNMPSARTKAYSPYVSSIETSQQPYDAEVYFYLNGHAWRMLVLWDHPWVSIYQINYSSSICFLLFSIDSVLKNDLGCVKNAYFSSPTTPHTYGYSAPLGLGCLRFISVPVILIHMVHESHFQKHSPMNLCYFIA